MKLWLLLSRFENGGLERVQANLVRFAQSGIDTWLVAGKFIRSRGNVTCQHSYT